MNSILDSHSGHFGQTNDSERSNIKNLMKIAEPGLASDHDLKNWTPSEKVLKAIRDAVKQDILGAAAGHNSNILEELSRYIELPVENIQTFAGGDSALEAIVRSFLEPGMEAIIAGPTVSNIKIYADIFGVGLAMHYGPSPFSADPEGIAATLRETHRMVYIGNPNNPTGTVYTNAEIRYILDCAPTNTLVLIDETYCDSEDYSASELIRRYENLIVIKSFSNVYGLGGLPFGYILASPDNIKMIERLRTGRKSSALTLAAASAVLKDLEYINRRVEQLRDNMIFLSVRLRGLGISVRVTPSDFILIRVADPIAVQKALAREGINAADISHLRQLERYIKVPVRDDESSARLVEAFEKMSVEDYRVRYDQPAKVILRRTAEFNGGTLRKEEAVL